MRERERGREGRKERSRQDLKINVELCIFLHFSAAFIKHFHRISFGLFGLTTLPLGCASKFKAGIETRSENRVVASFVYFSTFIITFSLSLILTLACPKEAKLSPNLKGLTFHWHVRHLAEWNGTTKIPRPREWNRFERKTHSRVNLLFRRLPVSHCLRQGAEAVAQW